MRMKRVVIIFAFVILLVAAVFFFLKHQNDRLASAISNFEECAEKYPVLESYPARCDAPDGRSFTQDVGNELSLKEHIIISVPRPLTKISSPVQISGKARGNWFFEASFPVELVDGNGNTLGRGVIQTDEQWMTENFVPFSGELEFETPKTKTGKLLIRNDNPSGLPENDKQLVIPVSF